MILFAQRKKSALVTSRTLQSFCIFYIVAWCVFPPLAFGLEWRIVLVLAFATWFFLEITRDGGRRLINGEAAIVFFVAVYMVFIQSLFGGWEDVNRSLQLFIVLVLAIIATSYHPGRWPELHWLIAPSLLMIAVACVLTLGALDSDPHAARLLVRSSDEAVELMESGVGGYGLVYASAALVAPLIYLSAATLRLSLTLGAVLLATLAASLYLVVSAGYMIAVFLMAITVACAFFLSSRHFPVNLFRFLVILFFAFVFLSHVPDLLSLGASVFQGTAFEQKFHDMHVSWTVEQSVGTVALRMERYMRSLDLFKSHPLFGVFSFEDIGKHSQIIDVFARFGFFVGVAFVFAVAVLPYRFLKLRNNVAKGVRVSVLVFCAGFLTLNNISAAHGAVVYILIPAFLSWVVSATIARMSRLETRSGTSSAELNLIKIKRAPSDRVILQPAPAARTMRLKRRRGRNFNAFPQSRRNVPSFHR